VLIVDDEKNIRVTLQQCLVEAGYETDVAVGGEHALEKAEHQTYDLILLDIKLPDLDGLEVLRRIKRRAPEQDVVMITAYGSVETAVQAMKVGAIDYLQKPFTPEEIRNVVSSVLGRRTITAEDADQSFRASIELAKACITRHRLDQAVPHLRRAMALDPESPEPFNLLGMVQELEGEVVEALKMYRAALAVDPTYQPAQDNLSRATNLNYVPPETSPCT
jgi:DNA-binding response OmpR family regulator